MREPGPAQQITLKRQVGYGDYDYIVDAEGSEQMQVDKHVERRLKTDLWLQLNTENSEPKEGQN